MSVPVKIAQTPKKGQISKEDPDFKKLELQE
jgi:hypothetical protein